MAIPAAIPSSKPPKCSRTPWRSGSNASKRLPDLEADALAGAVIHRHEDADPAVFGGHRGGHVRPPHHVRSFRDDGPVVGLGTVRMPDPLRGLEAPLPHQPPDSLLRSPDALVAEPGPDLAVALAVERGTRSGCAGCGRPAPRRRRALRAGLLGLGSLRGGNALLVVADLDRRVRHVPEVADAGQAVLLPRRLGGGLP
jgi:hypothetical protein